MKQLKWKFVAEFAGMAGILMNVSYWPKAQNKIDKLSELISQMKLARE